MSILHFVRQNILASFQFNLCLPQDFHSFNNFNFLLQLNAGIGTQISKDIKERNKILQCNISCQMSLHGKLKIVHNFYWSIGCKYCLPFLPRNFPDWRSRRLQPDFSNYSSWFRNPAQHTKSWS